MRQSGVWRMWAVCVCVLWVNQWAVAVTVRDRVGDGGRFDVVAVQADVQGGSARFTIHYGDDLIGMATGAGGTLSIDADRNRQTGLKGTPGFDCEITYSVSQLAPTATLTVHTGANAGNSTKIGAVHANGTQLGFTPRSVTLVVPLAMLGSTGDFDFALFAQGQFAVGDTRDRVPDQGVANVRTGQVAAPTVAGAVAPHTVKAPPVAGKTLLLDSVTTSVDGGNAVFDIRTYSDLPTDPLAFQATMVLTLLIDADRRLETGFESTGIPFLPFGADRKIRCMFMPGAQPTVEVITGVTASGTAAHASTGAGAHDFRVTAQRRRVRLAVPLAALGVRTAAFDWMLVAVRGAKSDQVDVFLDRSVAFDTGQVRAPLAMPANAVVVDDPEDASVKVPGLADESVGRHMARGLPNVELRRLTAALTPQYLMARITYQKPFTAQPEYFTTLAVSASSPFGGRRDVTLSVNHHLTLGPQANVLGATPAAGGMAGGMLGGAPAATGLRPAHQCVAIRGRDVFVLLPIGSFGVPAFQGADVVVTTGQIAHRKESRRAGHRPGGAAIDRLPNQASVRLVAH